MKAHLRVLSVLFATLLVVPAAAACPWCRIQARQAVYTPEFWSTTALLLLPLVLIALVGIGLHFGGCRSTPPDS